MNRRELYYEHVDDYDMPTFNMSTETLFQYALERQLGAQPHQLKVGGSNDLIDWDFYDAQSMITIDDSHPWKNDLNALTLIGGAAGAAGAASAAKKEAPAPEEGPVKSEIPMFYFRLTKDGVNYVKYTELKGDGRMYVQPAYFFVDEFLDVMFQLFSNIEITYGQFEFVDATPGPGIVATTAAFDSRITTVYSMGNTPNYSLYEDMGCKIKVSAHNIHDWLNKHDRRKECVIYMNADSAMDSDEMIQLGNERRTLEAEIETLLAFPEVRMLIIKLPPHYLKLWRMRFKGDNFVWCYYPIIKTNNDLKMHILYVTRNELAINKCRWVVMNLAANRFDKTDATFVRHLLRRNIASNVANKKYKQLTKLANNVK